MKFVSLRSRRNRSLRASFRVVGLGAGGIAAVDVPSGGTFRPDL